MGSTGSCIPDGDGITSDNGGGSGCITNGGGSYCIGAGSGD